MKVDDFGFSLVSEDTVRRYEKQLEKELEETQEAALSSVEYKTKLFELKAMIMPLLLNLAKDPEKTYIYWPDRVDRIEKFIKKIEDHVKE